MAAHYMVWFELQVMSHIYILRDESEKYHKLGDWGIAIMHFMWGHYAKLKITKIGLPEMPPNGAIEEILGQGYNPLTIKVDLYMSCRNTPSLTIEVDIFMRAYQFLDMIRQQEIIINSHDNPDLVWVYKCDNWSQSEDCALRGDEIISHAVMETENQYFFDERENLFFY
jgi:hypothetical protein